MARTAGKPTASEAVTPAEARRFTADLERLWPEGGRLGLAVSGGADSLALLLLAYAAIPGRFAVATVDHRLRPEAAAECAMVARVCSDRGIPCSVLAIDVGEGNLQAAARDARYAALGEWANREGLSALATAHHADDQAETLIMRLNRASGLGGLAGVRPRGVVPGSDLSLLRPLLAWRRAQLAALVARAALDPALDPSNSDDAYDRVRVRKALASADWLDVDALAGSAAHLADAEDALEWIVERDWDECVTVAKCGLRYQHDAPKAVALRIVSRIIAGFGGSPRGGTVARLVEGLQAGLPGNAGGVAASVEDGAWVFRPETPRAVSSRSEGRPGPRASRE
jgi:tRNA(Ile)-lysidine synthase